MATKNDTSKPHRRRNPRATKRTAGAPKLAKAAATVEALEDFIDEERLRLMKAHSILTCVISAMEEEGVPASDGPYWPVVIESANDLINESIRRLDERDTQKPAKRPVYEVREATADDVPRNSWLSTRDGDVWSDFPACRTPEEAEAADIAVANAPTKSSMN